MTESNTNQSASTQTPANRSTRSIFGILDWCYSPKGGILFPFSTFKDGQVRTLEDTKQTPWFTRVPKEQVVAVSTTRPPVLSQDEVKFHQMVRELVDIYMLTAHLRTSYRSTMAQWSDYCRRRSEKILPKTLTTEQAKKLVSIPDLTLIYSLSETITSMINTLRRTGEATRALGPLRRIPLQGGSNSATTWEEINVSMNAIWSNNLHTSTPPAPGIQDGAGPTHTEGFNIRHRGWRVNVFPWATATPQDAEAVWTRLGSSTQFNSAYEDEDSIRLDPQWEKVLYHEEAGIDDMEQLCNLIKDRYQEMRQLVLEIDTSMKSAIEDELYSRWYEECCFWRFVMAPMCCVLFLHALVIGATFLPSSIDFGNQRSGEFIAIVCELCAMVVEVLGHSNIVRLRRRRIRIFYFPLVIMVYVIGVLFILFAVISGIVKNLRHIDPWKVPPDSAASYVSVNAQSGLLLIVGLLLTCLFQGYI